MWAEPFYTACHARAYRSQRQCFILTAALERFGKTLGGMWVDNLDRSHGCTFYKSHSHTSQSIQIFSNVAVLKTHHWSRQNWNQVRNSNTKSCKQFHYALICVIYGSQVLGRTPHGKRTGLLLNPCLHHSGFLISPITYKRQRQHFQSDWWRWRTSSYWQNRIVYSGGVWTPLQHHKPQ